ncbi:MAG: hypothetical protein WBP12_02595 [Candidatus Saccharimonas sp.]
MNPYQQPQPPSIQPLQPSITPVPPSVPPQPPTPKKSSVKLVVVIVLVTLLVIAGAVAAYVATRPQGDSVASKESASSSTQQASTKNEGSKTPSVSTASETVTTNCYTFSAPAGYSVVVDSAACTAKLTSEKDPKTAIATTLLTTNVQALTNDVVDFINSRYKKLANDQGRTIYQEGEVSLNGYQTGVFYADSNSESGKRKKAFYTIVNKSTTSKAVNTTFIQAFLVDGYADSTTYDSDVRLVVSSFVIR